MRRCGLPEAAVTSMVIALQAAKHFIKTAYGRSKRFYGNNQYPPTQGCGQGNGAGPFIWLAISAVLLTIMKNMGWGLQFQTAMSLTVLSILGFAFIDDTDLVHSANNPITPAEDLILEGQRMVSMWEGLLSATGGDLCADKCYWYMLDFKYQANKWRYKLTKEMPGELYVQGNYRIKRLDPWDAEENLGVHLTMDGNWKAQIEALKEKAEIFGSRIKRGEIAIKDAWYTFSKAFMPSLDYCMPATSISLKDWERIIGPALGPALSRSGIVCTASRELVFTSGRLQGLDQYHPYFKQHILQLGIAVAETRSKSPMGKSISALAEETGRQAGVFGTLADIPRAVLVWVVAESWLRSLLLFADHYGVRLEDDLPQIKPKRQEDKALMTEFI